MTQKTLQKEKKVNVGVLKSSPQTGTSITASEGVEEKKGNQGILAQKKQSKDNFLDILRDDPLFALGHLVDTLDLMIETGWKIEFEKSEEIENILKIKVSPPENNSIKFIDFENSKIQIEFNKEIV